MQISEMNKKLQIRQMIFYVNDALVMDWVVISSS